VTLLTRSWLAARWIPEPPADLRDRRPQRFRPQQRDSLLRWLSGGWPEGLAGPYLLSDGASNDPSRETNTVSVHGKLTVST